MVTIFLKMMCKDSENIETTDVNGLIASVILFF